MYYGERYNQPHYLSQYVCGTNIIPEELFTFQALQYFFCVCVEEEYVKEGRATYFVD